MGGSLHSIPCVATTRPLYDPRQVLLCLEVCRFKGTLQGGAFAYGVCGTLAMRKVCDGMVLKASLSSRFVSYPIPWVLPFMAMCLHREISGTRHVRLAVDLRNSSHRRTPHTSSEKTFLVMAKPIPMECVTGLSTLACQLPQFL